MNKAKIVVLLSTYNGEKYLRTQIDSVLAQRGVDVSLFVRDDGSLDSTISILKEYEQAGKLSWYAGKNIRSAQSFFDLIFNAPAAEYYALCDQDDYWESDKLLAAIEKMKPLSHQNLLLYCSATKLVDEELNPLNIKNNSVGVTSYKQSIISTNATGCTMCFNKNLFDVIRLHRPVVNIMHDAWIHKLCLAVGGSVVYDSNSHILYRQHENNVIGATGSIKKNWQARWSHLKNATKIRSSAIKEIYDNYCSLMTEENRELSRWIIDYNSSFKHRLRLLFNREINFPVKKTDFYYRLAVLFGAF